MHCGVVSPNENIRPRSRVIPDLYNHAHIYTIPKIQNMHYDKMGVSFSALSIAKEVQEVKMLCKICVLLPNIRYATFCYVLQSNFQTVFLARNIKTMFMAPLM